MAALYSFVVQQNATFRRTVSVNDASGNPYAFPVGSSARMVIRSTPTTPVATFTLTTDDGGGLTLGPAGAIGIVLTADQTLLFPVGGVAQTYRYDLRVVFPSGDADIVLYGPFVMRGCITK